MIEERFASRRDPWLVAVLGAVADLLVSPEDRDLFLATLVSANAGLRASGDRLMPAQAEASAR